MKSKPKKPNRDDIIAARQIKRPRQRSSSLTASKVGHNDEESRWAAIHIVSSLHLSVCNSVKRPVNKKTKKGHREPSGLLPGWKPTKVIAKSGSTASINPEDDSAVRYGGLVADDEKDDIEAAGVLKATSSTARKALTVSLCYFKLGSLMCNRTEDINDSNN